MDLPQFERNLEIARKTVYGTHDEIPYPTNFGVFRSASSKSQSVKIR